MASLTPVEGDPFAAAPAAAEPRLTPVEGDPFASPDAAQAQGARDAAARRAPRPGRDVPQYDRAAPTSTWSDVADTAKRIPARFNEAGAKMVSHAVDAIPFTVNRLVRGENPLNPEQRDTDLHPLYNTLFPPHLREYHTVPPAQTFPEQIADASGDMLAANMPFMFGANKLANAGRFAVDAAPTVKNAAKSGYNAVADAIKSRPVGSIASEAGASVESGGGGEWLREHQAKEGRGPLAQRLAEIAGQTLTPTGMMLHPASLAASAAKPLARPVTLGARKALGTVADFLPEENVPLWMKNVAEATGKENAAKANATVSKELNTVLAKPEAQAGVAEAQRLETEIPGFKPGVARATNDPVLLNTQQQLDAKATGNELRTSQEAHDTSGQSLRNKFESLAPKTVDNPQDIVHGAENARVQSETARVARESELTGMEQAQTQGQIRQVGEALPDAERVDRGARFRDIHDEANIASDRETTRLRQAIARPDTEVEIRPATETEPAVTMTVNQVLNRRAAINQEMRQYQSATARSVEDVRAMGRLNAERQHLDGLIEDINLPGMQEYRTYYRDTHVPKFEEGAGRDTLRYDRFGYDKNKVPDEKVLDQFGGPNNISAARQFTATHGQNPEAVQLMVDHQLGRLKNEAIDLDTGAIKQGGVEKFLTKNRELLDALPPQVREAVGARDPGQLYARLGELEQRQRTLADTQVQSRLGASPEKTLDGALNDWQVMRDLKQTVRGNPQHDAALTRAVMDRAPDPTDAAKFGQWLQGHDRVLRQVLTPQHLADLKTIAAASEMHNRLPRPKGAVELPKSLGGAIGDQTGVTIPSAIASALSVARGRTSALTEAPMQGIKMATRLNDRHVAAAWREALSNPDMAKTLSTVVKNKQATPMQMSKMHTYLLASGLVSNVDNEQK